MPSDDGMNKQEKKNKQEKQKERVGWHLLGVTKNFFKLWYSMGMGLRVCNLTEFQASKNTYRKY